VRGERDRDQRRAKAGDAENQSAEKGDRGERRDFVKFDQALTAGFSE
jgi:hypothetical protein